MNPVDTKTLTTLEYYQLKDILPHAYPFLMIDRVIDIKKGESLVAIKNITANEWPFDDFSSDVKYFPETLLIEAAAQAALVLYHVSKVGEGEKPGYAIGKISAEFFKDVQIGDQIEIKVTAGKLLSTGGYADIDILTTQHPAAKIQAFFSVQKQND